MKKIVWYYDKNEDNSEESELQYRKSHRKTTRVKKCLEIVNNWIRCASILDVGCKSLDFVDMVGDQYTRKLQIDHYKPTTIIDPLGQHFRQLSCGQFIWDDFVPFDVVVCMEVLEHVEPNKRRKFAEKLLSVASKYLLISIPYNWKKDNEVHPHTGYNESNIMEWFYPYLPDVTIQVGSGHLIAIFNKKKEEIIKQELK